MSPLPFVFASVFLLPLIILVAVAAILAFWIWMIVDVAERNFSNDQDKIAWVLIIVLAGLIGAIIYYFVVKKK